MKIVLATSNEHKFKEISTILKDRFDKILSLSDVGINYQVEETGSTLEENALIKARFVFEKTGFVVLADDTGLMVDSLKGAPGVYSARYCGKNHDYRGNRELLLHNLKGNSNRDAHFETVIVLLFGLDDYIVARGRVDGKIMDEEHGDNGFGYDSIFYSYELKKTFGECSENEKNSVSHRARALQNLILKLKEKENENNSRFFR